MNWEEDMRAELSKLRAEVERLRAAVREKEQLELAACAEADELRASLAAATELLRMHTPYPLHPQVAAFLAAQPAAPARGCVHFDFMRGMVCDECKTSA
jgi:hypothetical protein